jgi:hypothetical protein
MVVKTHPERRQNGIMDYMVASGSYAEAGMFTLKDIPLACNLACGNDGKN